MGSSCGCGCKGNSCSCNVVPIPYYEDPCFQENQCQGTQVVVQYTPVIKISNNWAVPEVDTIIQLNVPGVTDMLIGSYLWNPTYGNYEVVSFDVNNQTVKVTKAVDNEVEAGVIVPSCTRFILNSTSVVSVEEDITELNEAVANLNLGWTDVTETWIYLSADTVTVPSNATNRYSKGDKISLVNGAVTKYFYIIDVAATVLTMTGGSDYSLVAGSIDSIQVSRAENPLDFPANFAWSPTLTGFSVNPSGAFYSFCIKGKRCFVDVFMPNTGTSSNSVFYISAPVECSVEVLGRGWFNALSYWVNNGSFEGSINGFVGIETSLPSTISLARNGSASGWTAANGKSAWFSLSYDI